MSRGSALWPALLLLAMAAPIPCAGQEAERETTRRFALVIGANSGGPGRDKLRYAVSDAKAMIGVLETMGGVSTDDSRLLVEPDRETFFWESGRLRERVSRAKAQHRRVEVILYYSGHADESNILIGRQKVSYAELRAEVEALRADVRIVILDSCASGAFIQAKGGSRQPPFLFDAAYDMKGFAVMTSSSANEASQESERIRSSFFTHHLIAGLRGAADGSQDGLVTLSEAYQYAFRETLSQTEKSASGPQHPSYNIQMSGTGDVVITDVRKSSTILRLRRDISGQVFIHDQANALVLEFQKQPNTQVELGLEKGKYRLILVNAGAVSEAAIDLATGETRELGGERFKRTEVIDTVARGDQIVGQEGWMIRKFRPVFYVGFYGKAARYEGRWTFMPGMRFGVDLSRTLSVGLSGFGQTSAGILNRPPFWGVTIDYVLFESGRLAVRFGTIVGFMYRDKEDEYAKRLSTVLEPGFGLTWSLSANLRLVTNFSLDFVNGTNDSLRRFSLGLGLILGKQ